MIIERDRKELAAYEFLPESKVLCVLMPPDLGASVCLPSFSRGQKRNRQKDRFLAGSAVLCLRGCCGGDTSASLPGKSSVSDGGLGSIYLYRETDVGREGSLSGLL